MDEEYVSVVYIAMDNLARICIQLVKGLRRALLSMITFLTIVSTLCLSLPPSFPQAPFDEGPSFHNGPYTQATDACPVGGGASGTSSGYSYGTGLPPPCTITYHYPTPPPFPYICTGLVHP